MCRKPHLASTAQARGAQGVARPKPSCSARTASSVYFAATRQETLISLVEIAWMLMSFGGEQAEHLRRDARVRAHAEADDRHLDDVLVVADLARAERLRDLFDERLRAREVGLRRP